MQMEAAFTAMKEGADMGNATEIFESVFSKTEVLSSSC
jgi:hypothetical protein